MSDVVTFIDTIGKDVSATVVPKIESLAGEISNRTFTRTVPGLRRSPISSSRTSSTSSPPLFAMW